ncbi:hypothetical protein D3C83_235380 [compost metagenome]
MRRPPAPSVSSVMFDGGPNAFCSDATRPMNVGLSSITRPYFQSLPRCMKKKWVSVPSL